MKWGEQQETWGAPPGADEEGKEALGNGGKWGEQEQEQEQEQETWGAPPVAR